jgi:hypothetical protein
MTPHDTHLCLVSAQATPNLLPVLDAAWRPKRVVLATTPDMKSRAKWISDVIRGRCPGVRVETLDLPAAYDYVSLFDAFVDFVAAAKLAGAGRTALNVTGGTKLMAVAAQEVFSAEGWPVFYVNVETDELQVIGERARSEPLSAPMKVREMLHAHGFEAEELHRPATTRPQREVAERAISLAARHGRALGRLNYLAASKEARSGLKVTLGDKEPDPSLREMLLEFEHAGQLHLNGQEVHFVSDEARVFVNGGWLEAHAYQVVADLRGTEPRISDVVMNLGVLHPNGTTRNEIDVAFLYRNTLHLIECKTANLADEGNSGDDKATEALYKLESLRKIGGLRTRVMALDYRGALAAHAANRDRARGAGIEIVAGRQLGDLRGFIQRIWLSRAQRQP